MILVLSGTSGAGKGAIGARLRELNPDLNVTVSWTTRPPRPGEVDGIHYTFVDRATFLAYREAGRFLEAFEVYGEWKGTPELDKGIQNVMIEVDVQGALAIRKKIPQAILIFVQAPDRDEQRRRLLQRDTETTDQMTRRLALAGLEEHFGRSSFDAVVINDDVERATLEILSIIKDTDEISDAQSA